MLSKTLDLNNQHCVLRQKGPMLISVDQLDSPEVNWNENTLERS